jgi:hypothetical protein
MKKKNMDARRLTCQAITNPQHLIKAVISHLRFIQKSPDRVRLWPSAASYGNAEGFFRPPGAEVRRRGFRLCQSQATPLDQPRIPAGFKA